MATRKAADSRKTQGTDTKGQTGTKSANQSVRVEADRRSRFSHIIARAWSDEVFKQRLISRPQDVFSEYKLDVPKGMQIRVVENTDDTMHFVLPAKPSGMNHISLDRLPIQILDSPCNGHEHSGRCDSDLCGHHTERCG